jgi:hypothetical protein
MVIAFKGLIKYANMRLPGVALIIIYLVLDFWPGIRPFKALYMGIRPYNLY